MIEFNELESLDALMQAMNCGNRGTQVSNLERQNVNGTRVYA